MTVDESIGRRRGPLARHGVRSLLCLIGMGTLFMTTGAAAAQERSEQPGQPGPERAHLQVLLSRVAPSFTLTRNPDGSGDAIQIDERGLFVDGSLVCEWPGGRYDPENSANMVLGYATMSADSSPLDYRGCRPGLPIISTWGDCGIGTATLYIEVLSRVGRIVETQYGARRYYLDLNDLPGDPRSPDPSLEVRLKGYVGWEWHPGCVGLHEWVYAGDSAAAGSRPTSLDQSAARTTASPRSLSE